MLVLVCLCALSAVACAVHLLAKRAETRMEMGTDTTTFHLLQRRYFAVYFLAAFSDWLQGPYVYKLYSHYGYTEPQIAVLYVIGFVSSMSFGTFVGSLADRFGRKRLCIVYCVLYSFCCLTKASPDYIILVLGRFFGGISTSILFSTFEAWYIHEHARRNYPQQWINLTMSKSTFYNAILAILAGVIANIVAENFKFGPVSPFILAIPCLLSAGIFTHLLWDENDLQHSTEMSKSSYFKGLSVIFTSPNHNLLKLGIVQSVFESVMYTFVFLWTPVLTPMSPPLGIVFSCFMVCIMIGSSLYSFLISQNMSAERLLTVSLVVAFLSLTFCTLATVRSTELYAQLCFMSFLLYEVSVGIYFPAIGYLRSRVVPEEYRASITNWFRVPMNLMVCSSLLLLRHDKTNSDSLSSKDNNNSSHLAFMFCSFFLIIAIMVSINFSPKCPTVGNDSSEKLLAV